MTAIVYAICKAILDSVTEWIRSPRVVRVVGGGSRLAERVRAEIRKRAGLTDADRRREGQRPSRDA